MRPGARQITFAPTFALLMRERQRPLECKRQRGCWVNTGSRGCKPGYMRCRVCNGNIQLLPMDEFDRQYTAWVRRETAAR